MTEDSNEPRNDKSSYEYEYKKQYREDLDVHDSYITSFDAYEAMLISQVYDSVSKKVSNSAITDSYTATLAMERAARVMGKLPEGSVEATGSKDAGKAALMDILRQKWIYPNANAQHDYFTKLQMWDLYSHVYGYMAMFYDWNVSNTGYVGPDCWLWNPRNLIPQQGRVSINDMDYVTALAWVGHETLEKFTEEPEDAGWDKDALEEVIEIAKNSSTSPDQLRDTRTTRTRATSDVKKGICLATRYESGEDGEWITFAPDHGCLEVRRIKNPHKNGKIPFVIKYSQPLFDNFYGLGDFQRAMPIQFARDGLTNFYFATIKRNLAPGIIVNANGVIKHTLDVTSPNPVIMETIPNSVRPFPTNTAGLATYQGIQTALTGSLLSLYGSQNASIPGAEALNPSQGKTPAAIGMYNDKEATRDGQDRMRLEVAIEQLTDGFMSLIVNIGTETIPITLFSEDIEELVKQGYTDIMEMVQPNESGVSGSLMIVPGSLEGVEYRFNIATGSTAKTTKEQQRTSVAEFMKFLSGYQNILKEDPRVVIDFAKAAELFQSLTDVKGLQDIVRIKTDEEMKAEQEAALEQQRKEAQIQADMQPPPPAPQASAIGGKLFTDPHLQEGAKAITQL